MTLEEAMTATGYLVAMTTGWTDEAVELYAKELMQLHDPEVAYAAVRSIITTDSETFRPSVGRIRAEYDVIARRRAQDEAARRPALPSSKQLIPPSEGYRIAWDAYKAECIDQGRKPNVELFATWMARATSNA